MNAPYRTPVKVAKPRVIRWERQLRRLTRFEFARRALGGHWERFWWSVSYWSDHSGWGPWRQVPTCSGEDAWPGTCQCETWDVTVPRRASLFRRICAPTVAWELRRRRRRHEIAGAIILSHIAIERSSSRVTVDSAREVVESVVAIENFKGLMPTRLRPSIARGRRPGETAALDGFAALGFGLAIFGGAAIITWALSWSLLAAAVLFTGIMGVICTMSRCGSRR